MPEVSIPLPDTGPILDVIIRPCERQTKRLQDAGLPIPPALPIKAMIDTGGARSIISWGIAGTLKAMNGFDYHALGQKQKLKTKAYELEVSVRHPDHQNHWIPLEAGTSPIAGTGVDILLGRDFLKHFKLTYDGPKGEATIQWEDK